MVKKEKKVLKECRDKGLRLFGIPAYENTRVTVEMLQEHSIKKKFKLDSLFKCHSSL